MGAILKGISVIRGVKPKSNQITKLKAELKTLENDPQYKSNKEKVNEVMEDLKLTGEKAAETKKYIVTMSRSGSEQETSKYTEILREFLPQISKRLKGVYEGIKKSHTSRVNLLKPLPSEPKTTAMGPLKLD